MHGPFHQLRRFLRELKRRKVYRVAGVYAAVAFVVVQAANLVFPALDIPPWAYSLVVLLALLGFPVALVLAWALEVTPEGVRRTPEAGTPAGGQGDGAPTGTRTGRGLLVALGLLAAAAVGAWYLTVGGGDGRAEVPDRSVAVLPFTTLGQGANPTFTQGIHDGLLTRLATVSDLQVISRTSLMRYRDTEKGVPQIARELGVRWVLEGGVQQVGNRVQVNAQLIDARDDVHAWAKSYRRRLTPGNLFAIQAELTKEIARSLEAQITTGERARVEREPTGSLEAYRLYVQGRTLLDQRTGSAMRHALDSFERAVEADSGYAPAWSGLADARILLSSYGHGSADTLLPQALVAVQRALDIDPELAEAHASLGLIRQDLWQDGPGAVRALRRAGELRPSYARAHHWLGVTYGVVGRRTSWLTSLERAAQLNPMSPSIRPALSLAYLYAGRPEESLRQARRAKELASGFSLGPAALGGALTALGRHAEAVAAFRRALERTNPGGPIAAMIRGWMALAQWRAGDTVSARKALERLREEEGPPVTAALARVEMEDREATLRVLRRVDFRYYLNPIFLRHAPELDPLRDEPRFRELLRRANETWSLEPDGSFPTDAGPGRLREAEPVQERGTDDGTDG